ncbi:hypothetical protein NIIDMKKI_49170 [Mycobacterium kansasii]|uniref:Small ribosomal subunit protein uS2 n=1 Tax=Mycobacterium kansasii TaxID=1768 RepID=A0A7G1IF97_MYCKA|nr:hypothetical protein NIIDMKKI_49170 [Mycobacterium kansasii]
MAVVTMKQLLDSGTHFGHQTRRWNPKMKRFIFTDRNGIYIIDLQQTLTFIDKAYEFVKETVAHGGTVLFVGTKKQAQESVAAEATRVGMPYVNQRWLGGMLTNFSTVHKRLQRLKELEAMEQTGGFEGRTKKEILGLTREKNKLERSLGGIRDMSKVPSAIWVVDTNKEHIAVGEARKLGIPVIAILDTNCDPDEVDYPIPGNDDAIRSAALLTKVIASAVAEGLQARAGLGRGDGKPEAETAEPLAEWEQELLAAATTPVTAGAGDPTAETPPNQPLTPHRKADHWRTSPLPMSSGFGSSPVPACWTARTRWPKPTATSTRPSRRSGSKAPRTSANAPSEPPPKAWSRRRRACSSS